MMVYPTNSPSSTHGTVRDLRKHLSFFASFAPTPRRCYHVDPLDEALHLRPCHLFYLEPITFSNPYPSTTKNPAPPVLHHEKQDTKYTTTQEPPATTPTRPSKPHRYFLQCWLPPSCHMQCFLTFNDMVSLPGTDGIIPFAILRQTLPYTYECTCSIPILHPWNISSLPIIFECDDGECQVPTTTTKTKASIPSDVSSHPPSIPNLLLTSTTTTPKTSFSRPPRKPPPTLLTRPSLLLISRRPPRKPPPRKKSGIANPLTKKKPS